MRTKAITLGLAIMVVAFAGQASAEDPVVKVVKPGVSIAPPLRIVSFSRSNAAKPGEIATAPSGSGAYTGGQYYVGVQVENTTDKPIDKAAVKLTFGATTLESVLAIPAKSSRVAIFTDPEGITSSCAPKAYNVEVTPPGGVAIAKKAHVTPTCTFTSNVDEAWYHATPDSVEYAQKDTAYVTGAKLVTPPTCSGGPQLTVRIYNHSGKASPSLIVQAKTPGANPVVKAQTAAAFPLAAKDYKELTLTPVNGANADVAPKLDVAINDWTHSLNIANGGITVETKRSCTLAFGLD